MIHGEVKNMDEQTTPREEYKPRPKWQVWLARVAVVIMIISILLYYYWIAYPYGI